jgi:hypothetical protein
VHRIRHDGRYFQIDAIHLCEPSPQRTPLIRPARLRATANSQRPTPDPYSQRGPQQVIAPIVPTFAGETDRYVNVHLDAITTEGQRLFVAEAPASTDVGGRFLSETLTRMQEMLSQEATKPGSSGKWQTEFYYDTPDDGVVVVAVTGERGLFNVAYELQTSTQTVKKKGKRADN